jgi:hypothetical protein
MPSHALKRGTVALSLSVNVTNSVFFAAGTSYQNKNASSSTTVVVYDSKARTHTHTYTHTHTHTHTHTPPGDDNGLVFASFHKAGVKKFTVFYFFLFVSKKVRFSKTKTK